MAVMTKLPLSLCHEATMYGHPVSSLLNTQTITLCDGVGLMQAGPARSLCGSFKLQFQPARHYVKRTRRSGCAEEVPAGSGPRTTTTYHLNGEVSVWERADKSAWKRANKW